MDSGCVENCGVPIATGHDTLRWQAFRILLTRIGFWCCFAVFAGIGEDFSRASECVSACRSADGSVVVFGFLLDRRPGQHFMMDVVAVFQSL